MRPGCATAATPWRVSTLLVESGHSSAQIAPVGSASRAAGKTPHPGWGMNQLPPPRLRRGGGRLAAFLYSPRGRARRGPAPVLVDSDLLARNGALTSPRARPRDRCRLLLRRPREDQRLHGRLPGAEPGPGTARGHGDLRGLRAGLQRAARERGPKTRLAGRLEPVLADPPRPRRPDRALHRDRPVADHALREPRRRQGARYGTCPRALPDRRPAGPLRRRGRDPEQLRGVHDP